VVGATSSEGFLVASGSRHYAVEFEMAQKKNKLECGPMPNVMVALPNIGGALCSTTQSLADAQY